jgi:guanylate kinase
MIFVSGIASRCASAFTSRPTMLTHAFGSSLPMVMASKEAFSFTNSARSDDRLLILDPLVICGPSGVGKGTIIAKYMDELGGSDYFGFSVSHTTRKPRPGEISGVHYNFVSQDEMKAQIEKGYFLEHAEVHGNLYGTSWMAVHQVVEQTGKRCLLDIDVQGVKKLRQLEQPDKLQPKFLFIAPPSLEVLQQRLIDRGTESAESLERRTKNAQAELEYGLREGNFDAVVVNNDLEEATRNFAETIRTLYPDLAS